MGLAVFNHFNFIIESRKNIVERYNSLLKFSNFRKIKIREKTLWNYSYYPIIFDSEEELNIILNLLNLNNIFPRRYFNPSLNTLPYINYISMPISESISQKVMCLPLYIELTVECQDLIIKIINKD